MQSVIIGKNQAGQRMDKFLHKYLPNAGTGFLYKMLRKKNITLNGKKAEGSEMLHVDDEICFYFADETFEKFSGKQIVSGAESERYRQLKTESVREYQTAYRSLKEIAVLYEDDHVVVLNKPTDVLTQKANPKDISLNEWLVGYLLEQNPALSDELDTFRPSVCNRLDRNTSGIVLCGKSLAGSQILSKLIKERTIGKFYRTICVGKLTKSELLEGYLTKDNATNKVTIKKQPGSGDYIKTAYRPLQANDRYTLLEVELITGKTHQIRAHLASIGHPVIGDFKYGNSKTNQSLSLKAQLLHAYRVEFPTDDDTLPENLRGRVVTAPYPATFKQLLQKMNLDT